MTKGGTHELQILDLALSWELGGGHYKFARLKAQVELEVGMSRTNKKQPFKMSLQSRIPKHKRKRTVITQSMAHRTYKRNMDSLKMIQK